MNELQRMQYMEALGVDAYVPRWLLPGAAVSVQASLPVVAPLLEQSNDIGAATTLAESKAGASGRSASALLDDLVAKTTVRSDVHASPQASNDAASLPVDNKPLDAQSDVAASVRFTLNIWRINQSLLVVDSHTPKSALPTAALLTNMLRAKNIMQGLPGVDTLQWPMFENNTQWGGLAEAREMVHAFLQSRLELQPVKYIWLMGSDAFDAVAPQPGKYSAQAGAALNIETLHCSALVMPSLADMLHAPPLKKVAWQVLCAHSFGD